MDDLVWGVWRLHIFCIRNASRMHANCTNSKWFSIVSIELAFFLGLLSCLRFSTHMAANKKPNVLIEIETSQQPPVLPIVFHASFGIFCSSSLESIDWSGREKYWAERQRCQRQNEKLQTKASIRSDDGCHLLGLHNAHRTYSSSMTNSDCQRWRGTTSNQIWSHKWLMSLH